MRQDVDLSARMVDLMDKWDKCWLDMELLGIHVEEYDGFGCHRKTGDCWVHHLTPTRLDGLMVANWSIPKSATRPKPSCIHADRDPRTDLKTMEFGSTGQWTTNGPNQIHKYLMDWVTETILRPFFRNFDVSLLTIAHRLVTIADYDKVPGQRGIGRGQRSRGNCWDSWSTRHFIPSSISGGHRWSQSCARLYMAIYIIIIIYGYMMLYELSGRCRWRRSCCLKLVEWRSSIHRGAMVVFFRGQPVVAVVEAKQNFWHRGCF